MTIRRSLAFAALLTGCGAGPTTAPVCDPVPAAERFDAARRQALAGDPGAAARLFLDAAHREQADACADARPCAGYAEAVGQALLASDQALAGDATRSWFGCADAHATRYVPSRDDRVLMALGARLIGQPAPHALPPGHQGLATLDPQL